jgi:hypothetical protein
MRKSVSQTFAAISGVVLLLGAAASTALAEPAGESTWFAPMLSAMAPGALKPSSVAGAPAAKSALTDRRLMLMKSVQLMRGHTKAPFGVDAAPQLQYYGGPLLGNVKVQLVYWNNQVAYQDKLPGFFSSITQSAYFDWLNEYNGGGTSVGRGSYLGAYTDSAVGTGQIEDADIRTELTSLLSKNAIPQPDANTLYMVYFPPGLNVDLDGSGSCQVFCAYHNTFMNGGKEVNYGVIPDQGGSCAGGCGGNADQFNNETSVSSHELIEAVTDPAVGLVTGNTPQAPLGWYDGTYGEIGDICNAVQAQVGSYTVQRVWSNSRGLCVASAADSGSPFTPQSANSSNNSGPIARQP